MRDAIASYPLRYKYRNYMNPLSTYTNIIANINNALVREHVANFTRGLFPHHRCPFAIIIHGAFAVFRSKIV